MSITDDLREVLLDRQQFKKLAHFYVEKSSALHADEADDPKFGEWLKVGLDILLMENLDLVFEYTQSPIETIFVNSLLLMFIKNDPLNLVVQHSVRNAPRQIEAFRERRSQFKKFMAWYIDKYGSIEGVKEYLDHQFTLGKMEPGENRYLNRHFVYYTCLGLEGSFHMILQPGLPDIRVDGRTVRPDLLFWVPSNEAVKIVVECDGYEYHHEKVVFIHDRKRDRALKAKGYEVLRYSGSEIYNDPVGVSDDLAEYLWSVEVNRNY